MSNLTNLAVLTIWLIVGVLLAFTLVFLIRDTVQANKRPRPRMLILAMIIMMALIIGPIGWFLLPFALMAYGAEKEGNFRADHPVHAPDDWHWS